MLIQCVNNPALYGFNNAAGRIFVVGEKRAFNGASIGGCTNAADDKLRSESMLIRAVGGGVDNSSLATEVANSGTNSFANSVAR